MAWYNILFFASILIFVVKLILSFTAGNIDLDLDFDDIDDVDISSFVSLKGLLNFILGLSTYYTISASASGFKFSQTCHFEFFDHICGVIFGIIFMVLLWNAYKITKRFEHKADDVTFENKIGNVQYRIQEGLYMVQVKTEQGTYNIECVSRQEMHPGDEVLVKVSNNVKYIKSF